MASILNPYLSFKDNAAEAMSFYQEVFGGELNVNTFGSMGMEGPDAEKIMHAQLTSDLGFTLMGADTPPGMEWSEGGNGTLSLSGDDREALTGYWEKLAADGQVIMPLERQMWGDDFGQLADKFGNRWMVNILGSTS